MMKSLIGILALTSTMSVIAVEGYDDIYLDKQKDIVIHGVMCGDDLSDFGRLKPEVVFTNTPNIEKGTYYFKSAYGEYSLTFKPKENDAVMLRGLLKGGKTEKADMEIQLCMVKDIEGLPKTLSGYLKKTTLKADDKNWAKTMEGYQLVAGKPAFGKGQY